MLLDYDRRVVAWLSVFDQCEFYTTRSLEFWNENDTQLIKPGHHTLATGKCVNLLMRRGIDEQGFTERERSDRIPVT